MANIMARSRGTTISVKVPINWDAMTKRTRQRLRQIVGRDTRVIRALLGIIEQNENNLLTGRKKNKIHDGKLDELTLTAIKVRSGHGKRSTVPHDIKARFPRISTNELQECRQTAVSLYESYLALREKKGWNASRPTAVNTTRRIPRWVFIQRFKLEYTTSSVSRWWLGLRDSLDSVQEGRTIHDKLNIPLKVSPFHHNQLRRGEVKACQVFADRVGKWWVNIAVRVAIVEIPDTINPPAVLGIDLGIEKAACTSLVSPTKVRETRYFRQKDKVEIIRKYDRLVADLQRKATSQPNNAGVLRRLRQIRHKRENVACEYDRVLVRNLLNYIEELSEKYTVYVAIGRLKNIRNAARKGNFKGRGFRGMIHSWAFARITESLNHGLAQQGWSVSGKNTRFRVVPEAWTSIMCWKCGTKGTRPKQNYFLCPSCSHQTNADRNGAINIAGRLIMLTKLLHSVRGLGKWAISVQAGKRSRLKARKKKPSKGKSLLSKQELISSSGESAAVHFAQTSLFSFGDKTRESDNDPAVVKTVETLAVVGSDDSTQIQEKEARSSGGIPSQ
ncbi:MAG: transposase [Candidatus Thorarchaeota archaeon]|nr:MAG: transposase [Candidatus Thorarchaeota archaeon]